MRVARCSFLVLMWLVICQSVTAQFYSTQYRPPHQQWQYLSTPHFKIVFSQGNDSTALEMGRILETQYPAAQQLVGGSLTKFPVILNSYNDRSNGFVTPFNFRSEIELPPIIGKSLNPQTGNWLENVGPHELVHALQFSHLGSYNIPAFLRLFSPDLARSLHSAIPFGMLEGVAVYHETKNIAPSGGRGNYPIFTNQFDAVFNSDRRWSMGQMMQTSSWTRPLDRHYIGGYEFTSLLQKTYGPETTRKVLDFYVDYPFLGYGVALRHVTGHWPAQLYNRFEDEKQEQLSNQNNAALKERDLIIPFKGREIRRPRWQSDSTLIFYGSFYNARSGFYQYNLQTNNMDHLITTGSVGDYLYDLSNDRSTLVFSYYEASTIYDNTNNAELLQYNFETGRKKQLTKGGRVYAPFFSDNQLFALQTQPASSRLVRVDEENISSAGFSEVLSLGKDEITAVRANPQTKQWAVVANKGGMQALWITGKNNLESILSQPPEISFEKGSVFDPVWHPDGKKLLFSSDFSGTHQIYEYDLQERSVVQLTQTSFNAFEGSYSPGGNRIAFIKQVENERLPAVLDRTNFLYNPVSPTRWKAADTKLASAKQAARADSMIALSKSWRTNDYRSGLAWLKPRTFFPFFDEISNRDVYETGLSLHSVNLLSTQAYSAELSTLEDRLWYDIVYKNTSFFPGLIFELKNQPTYFSYSVGSPSQNVIRTLLRQERSLSVGVPLRFRLNQNIFGTSLIIRPEIRRSQSRFLEVGSSSLSSEFAHNTISNIQSQFTYRLQQNVRDLQPNSGLVLFSEFEHYIGSDIINFNAYGNDLPISLAQPTGLKGGLVSYLSPFRRWNQSLQLKLEGLTQSGFVFDSQSLVSDAFSESILVDSKNLLTLSTRYTIPLTYVDNGGFLLPLYLSNIYLVAFSNSVTDPTSQNWLNQSRSVFGMGIRSQFRISNLTFEIGVGVGYEPSRGNTQFFIGDF